MHCITHEVPDYDQDDDYNRPRTTSRLQVLFERWHTYQHSKYIGPAAEAALIDEITSIRRLAIVIVQRRAERDGETLSNDELYRRAIADIEAISTTNHTGRMPRKVATAPGTSANDEAYDRMIDDSLGGE